jgi:DNA (cytosine-5)-methyltransferase 1
LFGIFAKHDIPIAWPENTHAKNPGKSDMFTNLKKWKPVREVLQLNEVGRSILIRKKPLSEKTLERVYAGLIKFVAGGKDEFIVKYNSNRSDGTVWSGNSTEDPCPVISTQGRLALCTPEFMVNYHHSSSVNSVDDPCPTLTTKDKLAIANPQFISKYYSGKPEHKNISIDGPAGTIRTSDGQALVSPEFLQHYYGNGFTTGMGEPSPTIRTKDGAALVQPQFIMRDFTNGGNLSSIESPSGAVMPNPKQNLVSAEPFIVDQNFNNGPKGIDQPIGTIMASRKHKYIVNYLMNPQYMNSGGDVNKPCFTLIARMDKMPPYLVTAENGQVGIIIEETDSPMMVKIKEFMALYGLADIYMRMLFVDELLSIQGFPKGYKLAGNQSDQKKFIGNSVVPEVITAWAMALTDKLLIHQEKMVA